MKVVSIGGIVNDDVNYHMWLEFPFSQPSLKVEQTRREGGDPVITRARREALGMTLGVKIGGATEAASKALREALLAALDTATAAVALVVSDDDDGAERYRYVVAQGVDEQRDSMGPGLELAVTLVTHGETRWRANTATSVTWNATASGDTTVVANGGSLPARPVYTIRPTDAKVGAGNAFAYRAFCAVKWNGLEARGYPTDVTDAGWDTDALITALKLYNGSGDYQDNVALQVDGRLVRRWFSNFEQPFTGVWANLDWRYYPTMTLLEGFGSGDTVTELAVDDDVTPFPFSGILLINQELFTYTGRDVATGTFFGVSRAAKGSTAASHTAGDAVHLIQHDIWLLYGGTGYWDNSYDKDRPADGSSDPDAYKPMIDLENSLNASWIWNEFGETDNPYRAAAWRPGGAPSGTLPQGDPWEGITLTNNSYLTAQEGESFWTTPIAHRVSYGRIVGQGYSFEQGTGWVVGLYIGGQAYIDIPELTEGVIAEQGEDFDLDATGTRYGEDVRFYQRSGGSIEVMLDYVRLDWENGPTVMMSAEVAVYDLALVLENVTSGQGITLTLPMELDSQIEVDTERHTVTLLEDGTSQYQALERDTRRREILPLLPGNNTLRVTEDGLQGVTVYITFEERSYS